MLKNAHNVKEIEKTLLDPFPYLDQHQKLMESFWADTHPQSKFHGNLSSRFCVILLTNQATKQQTDTGEIKLFSGENRPSQSSRMDH